MKMNIEFYLNETYKKKQIYYIYITIFHSIKNGFQY